MYKTRFPVVLFDLRKNNRYSGVALACRAALPLCLCFFAFAPFAFSQHTMQNPDFHRQLFDQHSDYVEKTITHRRFKHQDLVRIIDRLRGDARFEVTTVGKSFQGRDIFMVKAGTGKTNVLLWSQMHGNEATATMAMFDIFRFLEGKNDGLDVFRDTILRHLSLGFVPMLNPDGAEVFERRTAQGIDMNRDALRLQCPESQLLKRLQHELKPAFGFNLHDQDIRYTAGKNRLPATISLLAPPIDDKQTVNDTRRNAMQIIAQLNRHLQQLIPGQVGRWPDDFEPRAFGENMQQWGTSTILVESGGCANDPEKQFIRRLNFTLLLDAFQQIASQSFADEKLDGYYAIPHNEKYLFDLLVRNVQAGGFTIDIGINRAEKNTGTTASFQHDGRIDDWGDLSVFYGYQELDARNLQLLEGKLYPGKPLTASELAKLDVWDLLEQGYLAVRTKDSVPEKRAGLAFPIHTVSPTETFEPEVGEGKAANFLLSENGVIRYAVVNGFLHELRKTPTRKENE